jgi:hypothetical protein
MARGGARERLLSGGDPRVPWLRSCLFTAIDPQLLQKSNDGPTGTTFDKYRIRGGGGGGCFVVLAAQSLHAFVYHAEAVHEAQWMESEYRIQQPTLMIPAEVAANPSYFKR